MAYQPGIPLGPDKLSVSQGDLLNNFGAISTMLQVNHVNFNGAQQGMHHKVDYTDATAALPIAAGGAIVMYAAIDPAYPLLGQQLWVRNGVSAPLPLLASEKASTGWTILPSSIKMVWVPITWVAAGNNTYNLNAANLGASWPGFSSAVYHVQLTGGLPAGNVLTVVSIGAGPNFTVTYNSVQANGNGYLFAIGL